MVSDRTSSIANAVPGSTSSRGPATNKDPTSIKNINDDKEEEEEEEKCLLFLQVIITPQAL